MRFFFFILYYSYTCTSTEQQNKWFFRKRVYIYISFLKAERRLHRRIKQRIYLEPASRWWSQRSSAAGYWPSSHTLPCICSSSTRVSETTTKTQMSSCPRNKSELKEQSLGRGSEKEFLHGNRSTVCVQTMSLFWGQQTNLVSQGVYRWCSLPPLLLVFHLFLPPSPPLSAERTWTQQQPQCRCWLETSTHR